MCGEWYTVTRFNQQLQTGFSPSSNLAPLLVTIIPIVDITQPLATLQYCHDAYVEIIIDEDTQIETNDTTLHYNKNTKTR